MNTWKLKAKIEWLENKLNQQEEEISKLKKKAKRHKWLILSLLFNK
mgnify:CR=1 FL=1